MSLKSVRLKSVRRKGVCRENVAAPFWNIYNIKNILCSSYILKTRRVLNINSLQSKILY